MIHRKERTLARKNILHSLSSLYTFTALLFTCQPRFHSLAARFTTIRRLQENFLGTLLVRVIRRLSNHGSISILDEIP